jgi:hypothetical protein
MNIYENLELAAKLTFDVHVEIDVMLDTKEYKEEKGCLKL